VTTSQIGLGEGGGTEVVNTGALAEWLRANVEGYSGPVQIEQFAGGQSNPTYRLRTPAQDYVLRRKPMGELLKGAHAIEREYRVTQALSGAGFPVANPYQICTDASVIGSSFYVTQMVEGRIFWDTTMPSVSAAERPIYFDAMNSTIAALHLTDFRALGLENFGRTGNYFARQIARWSKQYVEDVAAGRDLYMDRLLEWLPEHIPTEEQTSIVHGDYRIDNMIFHPSDPRVLAVLDWELSTLGDPLADFTYHLMMYRLPSHIIGGLEGRDLEALSIPTEENYIAAYCRRTGRTHIPRLNFYMAFNMFRFAAILHGIKGRIARGTAASLNARAMADNFQPLAELAWAQVDGR
jgi:aminoglycoside phosphotransferase (APT) family kinase protein